jgi:predicted nuclease of predicted toxin-antitoxin system
MPKTLKLYLDQMFRVDIAESLRNQGYDVVRVSESGKARADDEQILQRAISEPLLPGAI